MVIGVTKNELESLKKIDLIYYFKETDMENIILRNNGTIVHKKNEKIVIYNDHSYQFDVVKHPYRDIIGTLQTIYNYSFLETIERLRNFAVIYDLDI